MKTLHYFVPALDAGELLSFTLRKTTSLDRNFEEQDRARGELVKFIRVLEKKLGQHIFYMGFDIIGEKAYERFILDKGGFIEVMIESPAVINAHFVHESQAKRFTKALKDALASTLPKTPISAMFIDSIELQQEDDTTLTVQKWNELKRVHDN
jgi:hypothetical protein